MEPADGATPITPSGCVRLPGIGTRYATPDVPERRAARSFGLPEGAPLFLCPQSLFKIHPDNDALFARVLAAAPERTLVMFEGRASER